ncbi:MAG: ABC transporter permease [Synergistaceae bacterium]|jgi:osmoprotectant transport system permease protein|nr:ABC transporter permease [Synergistaceae bacterium]
MYEFFYGIFEYIGSHRETWLEAVRAHFFISVTILFASVVIGVPTGALCAKKPVLSSIVINFFNILKVIPSLALLLLALPVIGIGFWPACFALMVHSIPTILISSYTGMRQVEAAILESAVGMGLSPGEIFWKVELPLAAPFIMTGVRTCAVDVIATTTIASYIGAGGLGELVMFGISFMNLTAVVTGGLTIASLSLAVDAAFGLLQRRLCRIPVE